MSRRVLVARLDGAGDVLLAGPAVRAVAAAPEVETVLLCGPQGAPAGRLLPGVAQVLEWSCPWILNPAPEPSRDLLEALRVMVRSVRAEEAVILTSFHQSPLPLALLLREAGVRTITGASSDYAGALLAHRLKPGEDFPEDQPEVDRALRIAAAAGFPLPAGDDGRLRLGPLPDVSHLVGTGPYIAVHPGAAVPARAWPALHHAAAVELLTAAGFRVVVTGGPGEKELTATVAAVAGLDLGGRTDLATLAAVLAGADAVVAGNTGPAHLAAAAGTPVVSLFAPVVPAIRWAPYGVPLELLGNQHAACSGTRARICPVPGHPCLSGVSPEQVVEAVQRLVTGVPSLQTHREMRHR
ncbi:MULTISPECIES: glycosyltransferase family 9 protein [unclassified Arthrobacter]|uniref:glycosyltransferase family 9 protein n=1 Tax=unclassified Arthrobacter TaxID=235627 RepID=UPI0021036459|nr:MULTISPECIES: glycosyltransferase family 9 protein [unclassified Arthrobacter]MCQ1986170.1 glycosyltransferase family 9 protein [Arthrobacter sp. zg-Y844]MCQ1994090.1 glycosyltransferase family 9 protein [Arthrobacter sp. zg-Y1171]UWX83496.1 glycosyltransferase family 9 protein [Arthrobacter sp. zg-Y1171]